MTDPIVFSARSRAFTRGQVLSAAEFRSDLAPLRDTIRLGLACQQHAEEEGFVIDADALQGEAERYRIERDLSTAEDTERWLADHDVTVEDFTGWLERWLWRQRFASEVAARAADYHAEVDDVETLVWPEVVFGGHLPALSRRLAGRVASLLECGRSCEALPWEQELAAMEEAYDEVRRRALSSAKVDRELDARKALLVRFDAETAVFGSLEAAREAWLCATHDDEPLEAVAARVGASYGRAGQFLDEFPESLQARMLSAPPGEILPPVEHGNGFLVCLVRAKSLPEGAGDPAVRARIEAALVGRAVEDLVRRHITPVPRDAAGG